MPLGYAPCPDCVEGVDEVTGEDCEHCNGSGHVIIEVDEEGEPIL